MTVSAKFDVNRYNEFKLDNSQKQLGHCHKPAGIYNFSFLIPKTFARQSSEKFQFQFQFMKNTLFQIK